MNGKDQAVIDAYRAITHYCRNNEKDSATRNHAFVSYIETLEQALGKLDSATPKAVENTTSALITDQAIEGYVSRAERFTEGVIKKALAPHIKKRKHEDFWQGVASSVLGSFIFTILLALVFWMARDQIRAWLYAVTDLSP